MFKFLWIVFMVVVGAFFYLFLVPAAIMFLWNNLIVVHNPDVVQMPYLIALGVMVLVAMIFKIQFINLKVNTGD